MAQIFDWDNHLALLLRKLEEREAQPKHQVMANVDYRLWLEQEWARLLNSDAQNDESSFQHFIEQHPCLLFDAVDDNRLIHHAIFSQPELPGFRRKYPDFLCISQNSIQITINLIEIEAPSKPWRTNSGQTSAKLTQALDQLRSWKVWFENPLNRQSFLQLYDVQEWRIGPRRLAFQYALIYGRRSEVLANEDFASQRGYLTQPDEFIMTYDRLRPSEAMMDIATVKLDKKSAVSRVKIIHIPPTLSSVEIEPEWYKFGGFDEAVRVNPFINEERKAYLIENAKKVFAQAIQDNLNSDLKST